MALKTDNTRTYERTVVDHEDGTEYTVNYRKLTLGDIEDRRAAAIKWGKKGKNTRWDSKAQTAFTIRRAVVSWDFPFPKTEKDIMELDYDIARQMIGHIGEITPSLASELRMYEEDEDEDSDDFEDEDDGQDDDGPDAPLGNGHHVEASQTFTAAPEPIFGEEGGPKEPAQQS